MENKKHIFKSISIRSLLIALAFWIPVGIFLKLAGEIIEKEPLFFDIPILEILHTYASPFLDSVFIAITNIGGIFGVLALTIVLLVFYIYKRKSRDFFFLLIGVAGSSIANVILKVAFQRDRPSLWHQAVIEHDFSFPSGHAMASAALATCLILIYWNTPKRWFVCTGSVIAVLLIGASRLYLGVHYPSDIIAGWTVSVVWVLLSFFVINKFIKKHNQTKNDAVSSP